MILCQHCKTMFRAYDKIEEACADFFTTAVYKCGTCNWYTRITYKSVQTFEEIKPTPVLKRH